MRRSAVTARVALPLRRESEPPSTTATISFADARAVISDSVEQPPATTPGNALAQGMRVVWVMVAPDVGTLV